MKLLTLLKDLPSHTLTGSPQVKISHLECDSRRILPGSCYIALKGTRADGHEFIPEAIRRGACAVVAEMPCTQEAREAGVSWVEVNDSRLAVSLMGAAWNGRPSRHMAMIGVTGTNGKTTTAYIAHSLLKQSWLRAGLIGTIAYDNGEEITPSTHTTPGPLELEHLLKEMYENGCRGVSMEVFSHALDQERVAGINFNVGIFTNLTQDHLDYHHTMENYFQAKAKLFEQMAQDTRSRRKPVAVINIDDAYGRRLAEMFSGRMTVKTYGSALGADFRMLVHHATAKGSEYELEYKGKSYLVLAPRSASSTCTTAWPRWPPSFAPASPCGTPLRTFRIFRRSPAGWNCSPTPEAPRSSLTTPTRRTPWKTSARRSRNCAPAA